MKEAVVLDTSIMEYGDLLTILSENFSKIVFTIPTIREMDSKKRFTGSMGYNIRNLLAECAYDKKAERYEVVEIEEKYSYPDDNVIEFLRANSKKYILLTADNAMACKCKAYGISYYFPWEFLNSDEELQEDSEIIENSRKHIKKKGITLRNCFLSGGLLYIDIPKNSKNIRILVFDAQGNRKQEHYDGTRLEITDRVYVMTYKREKQHLVIAQYEVCEIAIYGNADFLQVDTIKELQEICESTCPDEVKKEAEIYLLEVNN